ncbi:hypothetical protein E2C01_015534 [Portunus trituberculatus]|uniref:Uncharacterized protein n=1 Tax=Portunus trituberculatus TaxID=210409 RepID=A0A5B7DN19_PORTR|nr:hypothetical protein [Portunus trituberculatus]
MGDDGDGTGGEESYVSFKEVSAKLDTAEAPQRLIECEPVVYLMSCIITRPPVCFDSGLVHTDRPGGRARYISDAHQRGGRDGEEHMGTWESDSPAKAAVK